MKEIMINGFYCFRAGERHHQVTDHVNTQLLTACGLHFHEATASQKGKGRMCRNCRRFRHLDP
jgi:hypothetical protein